MTFLSQMEPVPDAIHERELHNMIHMAKGPTAWANASDLWRMGEQCGIGRSFHCIRARGQAAMLRTYYFENWEKPIREEVKELTQIEARTEQHDRSIHWRNWYRRSFPKGLQQNKEQLTAKGISMQVIKSKLCPGKDPRKERDKFRAEFQREVAKANLPHFLDNWHKRVSHKLVRWKLPGNRHHHADKVSQNLHKLGKLVAPRVAAANWGLAWNRWCTARRFQGRAPCVLGCGNGEDSIEHYWCCAVVKEAGKRMLRIEAEHNLRKSCMLGAARFSNDDEQTCWALLVYGVYMTTNATRQHGEQSGKVQELMQHIRQAVEGHKRSSACLNSRWCR
jgi:hypothetical protein